MIKLDILEKLSAIKIVDEDACLDDLNKVMNMIKNIQEVGNKSTSFINETEFITNEVISTERYYELHR